jgi:hypothetical protein
MPVHSIRPDFSLFPLEIRGARYRSLQRDIVARHVFLLDLRERIITSMVDSGWNPYAVSFRISALRRLACRYGQEGQASAARSARPRLGIFRAEREKFPSSTCPSSASRRARPLARSSDIPVLQTHLLNGGAQRTPFPSWKKEQIQ